MRLNHARFGQRAILVVVVLHAVLGGTVERIGIQHALTMRLFGVNNSVAKSRRDLVEELN